MVLKIEKTWVKIVIQRLTLIKPVFSMIMRSILKDYHREEKRAKKSI